MDKPLALVVDDDTNLTQIFSAALKAAGFQAEICVTGDAALERIASRAPALVVLDLALPGVSGLDVLREIRDGLAKTAYVIVITAHQGLLVRAQEEADQVFLKPVSYSQLRNTAAQLRPLFG